MANLFGYRDSFGNVVTLSTDQIVQGTKRFRSFDNNYNGNLVDVQTIVCKGQCDVVGNLIAQNNMNVNGTLSVSGDETVTGVLTATNASSVVTRANKVATTGVEDASQYYIPFVLSKDSAPNGQVLYTDSGATGIHLGYTPQANLFSVGNSGGANGSIAVNGSAAKITINTNAAANALEIPNGNVSVPIGSVTAANVVVTTGITLPTTIATPPSGTLGYYLSLATNDNGALINNTPKTVSVLHTIPAGIYIVILNSNMNTNSAAGNLQYTSMGLSTSTNAFVGGTGEQNCGQSTTMAAGAIVSFSSFALGYLQVPTGGGNYYIVVRAVFTGFTMVHNSLANAKLIRIA